MTGKNPTAERSGCTARCWVVVVASCNKVGTLSGLVSQPVGRSVLDTAVLKGDNDFFSHRRRVHKVTTRYRH